MHQAESPTHTQYVSEPAIPAPLDKSFRSEIRQFSIESESGSCNLRNRLSQKMPIIKEEKLSKNLDSTNFDGVKKQVVGGIYEDWKRDTVDSAKKRAIYNAPTYDAFKSLVAGCISSVVAQRRP